MNKLVGMVLLICATVPYCYANDVTAQFKVTASVTNGCIFNDSNPVNVTLPTLLPEGNGITQSADFQLECTPGLAAQISINNGEHADKSGSWNLALDGQSDVLIPYLIYFLNSGQKTLWSNPITFNSDQLSKKIDIEIEVPQPRTLLQPGHYSDTDIVTVSY